MSQKNEPEKWVMEMSHCAIEFREKWFSICSWENNQNYNLINLKSEMSESNLILAKLPLKRGLAT